MAGMIKKDTTSFVTVNELYELSRKTNRLPHKFSKSVNLSHHRIQVPITFFLSCCKLNDHYLNMFQASNILFHHPTVLAIKLRKRLSNELYDNDSLV